MGHSETTDSRVTKIRPNWNTRLFAYTYGLAVVMDTGANYVSSALSYNIRSLPWRNGLERVFPAGVRPDSPSRG